MEDCPVCENILVPEWDGHDWILYCYMCKYQRFPTEEEMKIILNLEGEGV